MLQNVINDLILFLLAEASTTSDTLVKLVKAAEKASAKAGELQRRLKSSGSIAMQEGARIKNQTGYSAESNPYWGLDNQKIMFTCLAAAQIQRARPELIMTFWMLEKEKGKISMPEGYTFIGPQAVTSGDDAKAMFIAYYLYDKLGADELTSYDPTKGENALHREGRYASEQRAALDRGNKILLKLSIAKDDFAKEMRNRLKVRGGTGAEPFRVEPELEFHAVALCIAFALYESKRIRNALFDEFSLTFPLSEQMGYLVYNNGAGSRTVEKGAYAILKATVPRAAAAGLSLQDFLLLTPVIKGEWDKPRKRIIEFDYRLKCYAPIFA